MRRFVGVPAGNTVVISVQVKVIKFKFKYLNLRGQCANRNPLGLDERRNGNGNLNESQTKLVNIDQFSSKGRRIVALSELHPGMSSHGTSFWTVKVITCQAATSWIHCLHYELRQPHQNHHCCCQNHCEVPHSGCCPPCIPD